MRVKDDETDGVVVPDHDSVSATTLQALVVTLVFARLDYGNGVLVDLPTYLMRRHQLVQHAAARLIFNLKRSDHIADAFISLHWLRIPERIRHKVAVLTHKLLQGIAPRYLLDNSFASLTCLVDMTSVLLEHIA
jgi:hypothetical protein